MLQVVCRKSGSYYLIRICLDARAAGGDRPDRPARAVITALAERLAKRKSHYDAIFRALPTLAKAKPDKAALEALLAEPDPEPDDLEALDGAWEEE